MKTETDQLELLVLHLGSTRGLGGFVHLLVFRVENKRQQQHELLSSYDCVASMTTHQRNSWPSCVILANCITQMKRLHTTTKWPFAKTQFIWCLLT